MDFALFLAWRQDCYPSVDRFASMISSSRSRVPGLMLDSAVREPMMNKKTWKLRISTTFKEQSLEQRR